MKKTVIDYSIACLLCSLLVACDDTSVDNEVETCTESVCDESGDPVNNEEETCTESDCDESGDPGNNEEETCTESDCDESGDPENNEDESEPDDKIVKSCKRGVAYGYHSEADMIALSSGVSWWYNWSFTPDSGVSDIYQDLDVEYAPMYWGDNIDASTITEGISSDATVFLGFNEPNFYSQANLSATDAASLWPKVEQIADDNDLYLLSPAVNYCGDGCYDTDPVSYLNDFFYACTDCRVDAIGIHIYVDCDESSSGLADNKAQWLINHVETYKKAFDQPLWLTEFACSGNPTTDEQIAFLKDAVAYLESEPRVERYAWFAGRADNMVNVDLLGDDGELTELGESYVDAAYDTTSCE